MGIERAGRAKQFMPFAALNGFYDLIERRELIFQPRREHTEEEERLLSHQLSQLKKGMLISIVWYHDGCYETTEGMFAGVDLIRRTITLVKTEFPLDDLFEIRGTDIDEELPSP